MFIFDKPEIMNLKLIILLLFLDSDTSVNIQVINLKFSEYVLNV